MRGSDVFRPNIAEPDTHKKAPQIYRNNHIAWQFEVVFGYVLHSLGMYLMANILGDSRFSEATVRSGLGL